MEEREALRWKWKEKDQIAEKRQKANECERVYGMRSEWRELILQTKPQLNNTKDIPNRNMNTQVMLKDFTLYLSISRRKPPDQNGKRTKCRCTNIRTHNLKQHQSKSMNNPPLWSARSCYKVYWRVIQTKQQTRKTTQLNTKSIR